MKVILVHIPIKIQSIEHVDKNKVDNKLEEQKQIKTK